MCKSKVMVIIVNNNVQSVSANFGKFNISSFLMLASILYLTYAQSKSIFNLRVKIVINNILGTKYQCDY